MSAVFGIGFVYFMYIHARWWGPVVRTSSRFYGPNLKVMTLFKGLGILLVDRAGAAISCLRLALCTFQIAFWPLVPAWLHRMPLRCALISDRLIWMDMA